MAEQPSSVREPAAAPVAPPKAIGAHVPEGIAFGERRMHNRTKTLTAARKVRIRSRNRINECPEPAGKGHFCTPKRPKAPENALFLPETGRFSYAYAALRTAPTRRPARPQRPFALSPSSPVTLARHPGVHRFCPISAGPPCPPSLGGSREPPRLGGQGGRYRPPVQNAESDSRHPTCLTATLGWGTLAATTQYRSIGFPAAFLR
jgi:hypothetical protein